MRAKLICLGLVLGFIVTNFAVAADPSLMGWWKLDETTGSLALDSSVYGHDGTMVGDANWVKGQLGGAIYLDGTAYLSLPIGSVVKSLVDCTIGGWVNWTGQYTWERIFDFGSGTSNYMFLSPSVDTEQMRFEIKTLTAGTEDRITLSQSLLPGWHHVTVTIDSQAQQMSLYLDGSIAGVKDNMINKLSDLGATNNNWLGRSQFADYLFEGYLDDFYIFNRVLSLGEIKALSTGHFESNYASEPVPADGQEDVSRDVTLGWDPGDSAQKHVLYFGDDFNDVNNGSSSQSVQIDAGQINTATVDPGRLEFNRRYYWRVDEVNGPPDYTVFKGDVWSFFVEPDVIPIPPEYITATASSYIAGRGPEKTIDGSGMDVNDRHSTVLTDMWLTAEDSSLPSWIQYEFDRPYRLNKMRVWNYNGESFLALLGIKDAVIETSLDGVNWTPLDGPFEFPLASGTSDYASNITVNFGNVVAKYVRITAQSNYSGGFSNQCGLSEVRLLAIPLSARNPEPESGADHVDPRSVLSWRAGREADTHRIYLDSQEDTVNQGTAPVRTTQDSQINLSQFDLQVGQTYYWRVDEVNESENPSTWSGETWVLTTTDTLVVDDFESYGNALLENPFMTWIDGLGFTTPEPGNPGNNTGAFVGHDIWTPSSEHYNDFIMENHIAHGGSQSLPVYYDNSGFDGHLTYSQIDRTFNPAQDWTQFGATTLVVHFYGSPGNTGQLYVKINNTKIPYPGPSADLATEAWTTWEIDLASSGTDLANVSTLSIGIDGSGASGLLYIDDIWLK